MAIIVRLFFIFNSLLLSYWVFEVKSHYIAKNIMDYANHYFFKYHFIANNINIIILIVLFTLILICSWFSLWLLKFKQSESNINTSSIVSIETANDDFLPVYLGYFFIALSVDDVKQFVVIFILIGLFIYKSRVSYFNPIFLLFGYRYYKFSKDTGIEQLFITKYDVLSKDDINTINFKRINNYTFLQTER